MGRSLISPGLHVVDDAQVVLVAADAALHLVEEVAQLHEDDQTGHGEPDVPKQLVTGGGGGGEERVK